MLNFVLPIIKAPYNLWSSNDLKIMQLVPSVVINSHFLYSKKVAFTAPKDVSLYATFNSIFWPKNPSLEIQRRCLNTLIPNLKQTEMLLKHIISQNKNKEKVFYYLRQLK